MGAVFGNRVVATAILDRAKCNTGSIPEKGNARGTVHPLLIGAVSAVTA
jgi:hypothetical protein